MLQSISSGRDAGQIVFSRDEGRRRGRQRGRRIRRLIGTAHGGAGGSLAVNTRTLAAGDPGGLDALAEY